MGTLECCLAKRRTIRRKEYDYTSAGMYFITVSVDARHMLLGDVIDGDVNLCMEGQMVGEVWDGLGNRFPGVTTDAFVVMPNHVHGIVALEPETGLRESDPMVGQRAGAMNRAPTPSAHPGA